jgi:hypothetical protein
MRFVEAEVARLQDFLKLARVRLPILQHLQLPDAPPRTWDPIARDKSAELADWHAIAATTNLDMTRMSISRSWCACHITAHRWHRSLVEARKTFDVDTPFLIKGRADSAPHSLRDLSHVSKSIVGQKAARRARLIACGRTEHVYNLAGDPLDRDSWTAGM